ncbi:long-chain-fatty-acid--CoA ligase [bacterium BMS3Abin10]|nr:long-chain-fatty-acid--CoA ligase [bacterium BMS3Abin10]GBE39693.1 long-chain-fatty-acid--CoA ligase [bacterium BMS3Bbin08]
MTQVQMGHDRHNNMTLSEALSESAKAVPRRTCISFEGEKLSYARIDAMVSQASGGLQGLGLNVRDRAAILMDNCPGYMVSYFAILRAGGIVVPLNTFLVADEIAYILGDAGCGLLIFTSRFRQVVREIEKKFPGIKAVMFDDIPRTEAVPYAGSPDDTAALLYTSGTTGFPKGAVITHLNLLSNVEACVKVMRFTRKDRVLLFLPMFHAFSFTVCVLLPIYAGARIVLLGSVKPFSRVLKSLVKDRITLFVAVPTVYNLLARKKIPLFLKHVLKLVLKIRACVSGASALPGDTIRAFEKLFNIPLLEGYGLTEASPVVAVNPLSGTRKPGSVGPPVPGVEAALIKDNGEKTASGGPGELIVRGPNVMKGYFNKDDETKQVLRDGWLHTGDMAKIDGDGYIYIVDRKKDIIIVDGMNIYPGEVENSVLKHPAVEECAMVGMPHGKGAELAQLFLKKKEGAVLEEKELRDYLKKRIAQFKIPRRFVFIDEFPKTATGKIKKYELKKCGR